jgi:DNA-binding IclR family transcriptional regulator
VYSRIGRRVPLHCSGVGKALIAFKPEKEIQYILKDYDYIKQTSHTLTNEKDFIKELEKVRERGYAVDNEENEPGVRCLAVPIRDHSRQVVAAISISMPAARLGKEEEEKVIDLLKRHGHEISRDMGYEHHIYM